MTVANDNGGRMHVYVVNTAGTYSATMSTPTGTALTLANPTAKQTLTVSVFDQVTHALRVLGYASTMSVTMMEKGNDGAFRATRTGCVSEGQHLAFAKWDGTTGSIFDNTGDGHL